MIHYDEVVVTRWQDARCANINTDLFMEHDAISEASKLCNGNPKSKHLDRRMPCKMRFECFCTAVAEEHEGMWGGVWFGASLIRDSKATTSKTLKAPRVSRQIIEVHTHRLMRYLGLTTEEYVIRYGSPISLAAFKKALRSLPKAKTA